MSSGLTSSIDLAEILFTLFWLFFAALVFYIRREDKREGYPLESDRSGSVTVQGFPSIPSPKEFRLAHGGTQTAPREEAPAGEIAAQPAAPHPGAPLVPTGDPMLDGVGVAAWANRSDTPDLTLHGTPRFVPMRSQPEYKVDARDPDPRGMPVLGADGEEAGTVTDLWVDLSEPVVTYLEVVLGGTEAGRHVMVPFNFATLDKKRGQVRVDAIYAKQFANIPALKSPDQITLLEEDRICAYFGGGLLYADERRSEPLV